MAPPNSSCPPRCQIYYSRRVKYGEEEASTYHTNAILPTTHMPNKKAYRCRHFPYSDKMNSSKTMSVPFYMKDLDLPVILHIPLNLC